MSYSGGLTTVRSKKRSRGKRGGGLQHVEVPDNLVTPDSVFVKLNYTFDTGAYISSATHNLPFYGNNVHDPFVGILGVQPTGFDQWMALYRFAYVYESAISCTFVNQKQTHSVNVYLQASDVNGITGNPLNQPNTIYRMMGPATGANNFSVLKMRRSTEQIFGRDRSTDKSLWCTDSSGPNTVGTAWVWNVRASQPDAQVLDIYVKVVLTYFVKFFDRRVTLGNS